MAILDYIMPYWGHIFAAHWPYNASMSVPFVAVECPQWAHGLHYTVFNWPINGLTMPSLSALLCLLGCIIMFLIALNEPLEDFQCHCRTLKGKCEWHLIDDKSYPSFPAIIIVMLTLCACFRTTLYYDSIMTFDHFVIASSQLKTRQSCMQLYTH